MQTRKRILAVSFGTSYQKARDAAIGGIERAMEEAFPEYEVRRCFTSGMVITHILKEEGLPIDDPETALHRAVDDQVKELYVQPTHIMAGYEYQKFLNVLDRYHDRFETVRVGDPLLTAEGDYSLLIDGICEEAGAWDTPKTAVILVGHGSESEADQVYEKLQEQLHRSGHENYYVGTIESSPSAQELCGRIRNSQYQRILLLPLMVVAGEHAINDIAGEEGSWKQLFEQEGYEVIPVMKGLGEYPKVQQIYVQHLKNAAGME